jgi:tetrahydromethanopterin:alpha-L-glutamate ligase
MHRSPETLAVRQAAPCTNVALVGDRVDWHARSLAKALACLGVRAVPMRLEDCRFQTDQSLSLCVAGFDGRAPDAVVVRSMSGGSFEAVTLRLGILHALRDLGVLVWNNARAIERCVDKATTSFLLARAGVPTPTTWATESLAVARDIVQREAPRGPLVLKPLFGSQGRGLRLVRSEHELPDPAEVAGGVYYLQRYVGAERAGRFQDFRLLVSQGRVIAAMTRHAAQWITNVKQGGRPVAMVPDAAMRDLAIRAAAAVGANFAGIDLLHDAEGRPMVLEVNSMPAWSGLQRVSRTNIASVLASDLVNALAGRAQKEVAR